ncbi:MAG: phage tail protein [candidate division Zixibacteria bacterium]
MPGFKINNQGEGPSSTAEVRRTHRWLWETLNDQVGQEVLVVLKSASRPVFNFEEPVMHHNQEQVYFAGKQNWEPISMSWYDVEQAPDVSAAMYDWLQTVVTINEANVAPPQDYKKTSSLNMIDGEGTTTETWKMYNGWPQNTNWGALDYTSTELQLIEVKYRFDRAERTA